MSKVYKLYTRPRERLLDSFGLLRGARAPKLNYALNDINIEITRGETVGIIGTNGSGKSTLLKIITGVLTPTSGEVKVDGRISALLELGAGFNMEYNGIDNIYLNGTMMGYTDEEIEAKLPSILEFADIGDYVYQPVKMYSSGMFVRLAFAVAINIDPEILIVDEALSVGDLFFQAKCYKKFDEFKQAGKTIIFVSHDLSSIAKYCDRVYLLNKGELLGCGSAKEMIDEYKQVLVGQDPSKAGTKEGSAGQDAEFINPDALEYGTGQAVITRCTVTDDDGRACSAILKGSRFSVRMRVKINEDLEAPIFAFSLKDVKGTEITGTNTMFEKCYMEPAKAGSVKEITFTQDMMLQGGDYLISLGVTGYEGSEFKVYHRLYDCVSVTVVSDKDTVGYYDMGSVVSVVDVTGQEE